MSDQDRPGSSGTPWWARVPAPPAALSVAQLEAALADVRQRREQVGALREQLAAFDEQLTALDRTLRPLLDWASAWAELERGMLGMWRPSPPANPPETR